MGDIDLQYIHNSNDNINIHKYYTNKYDNGTIVLDGYKKYMYRIEVFWDMYIDTNINTNSIQIQNRINNNKINYLMSFPKEYKFAIKKDAVYITNEQNYFLINSKGNISKNEVGDDFLNTGYIQSWSLDPNRLDPYNYKLNETKFNKIYQYALSESIFVFINSENRNLYMYGDFNTENIIKDMSFNCIYSIYNMFISLDSSNNLHFLKLTDKPSIYPNISVDLLREFIINDPIYQKIKNNIETIYSDNRFLFIFDKNNECHIYNIYNIITNYDDITSKYYVMKLNKLNKMALSSLYFSIYKRNLDVRISIKNYGIQSICTSSFGYVFLIVNGSIENNTYNYKIVFTHLHELNRLLPQQIFSSENYIRFIEYLRVNNHYFHTIVSNKRMFAGMKRKQNDITLMEHGEIITWGKLYKDTDDNNMDFEIIKINNESYIALHMIAIKDVCIAIVYNQSIYKYCAIQWGHKNKSLLKENEPCYDIIRIDTELVRLLGSENSNAFGYGRKIRKPLEIEYTEDFTFNRCKKTKEIFYDINHFYLPNSLFYTDSIYFYEYEYLIEQKGESVCIQKKRIANQLIQDRISIPRRSPDEYTEKKSKKDKLKAMNPNYRNSMNKTQLLKYLSKHKYR